MTNATTHDRCRCGQKDCDHCSQYLSSPETRGGLPWENPFKATPPEADRQRALEWIGERIETQNNLISKYGNRASVKKEFSDEMFEHMAVLQTIKQALTAPQQHVGVVNLSWETEFYVHIKNGEVIDYANAEYFHLTKTEITAQKKGDK